MNKKTVILILALIVIALLVFWFFFKKPSEKNELKEEIAALLEEIIRQSELGFAEIKEVEVVWNVKKEETTEKVKFTGKGFEARDIDDEKYKKAISFFSENGFRKDFYNMAAGTVSELIGYRKGFIICTITGGFSGYKTAEGQWIPSELNKKEIEVKCAKGDSSIEHFEPVAEIIKEIFARKHNLKTSQITAWINKQTEKHIAGTLNLEKEKGVENTNFLAANTEEGWKLVYDGYGTILCLNIKPYDFPADMVKECVDEQGKIEKRD